MEYDIKKITKEDSRDFAQLVTTVWIETYRGMINDDFLSDLVITENYRAKQFYNEFDEKDNHLFVLETDETLIGFVNVGLTDDETLTQCGEIFAIYLLKEYKGKGFGRKLFETGITELKEMNCDKMIVGCLKENPSNTFYQHVGGVWIKERIFEKLGLNENVYLFEKI